MFKVAVFGGKKSSGLINILTVRRIKAQDG